MIRPKALSRYDLSTKSQETRTHPYRTSFEQRGLIQRSIPITNLARQFCKTQKVPAPEMICLTAATPPLRQPKKTNVLTAKK